MIADHILPPDTQAILLLCGYFYSELPAASALLLAASPLAAVAVPRARYANRGALSATAVPALAAAAPIVAAVVLAYATSPPLDPYY